MKTQEINRRADFFLSGCYTDFSEPVKEIANLHSFGLSKSKSTLKENISARVERKITDSLDVNDAYGGNVWYGSCKYPNCR
jgi:hypothetical protein